MTGNWIRKAETSDIILPPMHFPPLSWLLFSSMHVAHQKRNYELRLGDRSTLTGASDVMRLVSSNIGQ